MHTRRHKKEVRQPLAVYISPELESWFRAKAKAEMRTLSGMAEIAMRTYRAMVEQSKVRK